eukprot:TRINITY_DN38404_c0_g1_i1.p1 TRINITY_DN38404_c0_g1~~TRINITY_DN38404_c0_g1_i1.p1  ORF type:complete len:487 (+),score=40.57 TRINITY_DN38404_c0_g1_i1:85-1545(+)
MMRQFRVPLLIGLWNNIGCLADFPCEVTFLNAAVAPVGDPVRDLDVTVSRVPPVLPQEVVVGDVEEWAQVSEAISTENLRLHRLIRLSDVNSSKVDFGAKLVSVEKVSIYRHGPAAIADLFVKRSRHAVSFPLHLRFRLDTIVGHLSPGKSALERTLVGQRFELEATQCLAALVTIQKCGEVTFQPRNGKVNVARAGALVRSPSEEQAMLKILAADVRVNCSRNWKGYPDELAYFCGPKHDTRDYVRKRLDITESYVMQELTRRIAMERDGMSKQVRTLPRFTTRGFTVTLVPKDVMHRVRAFYVAERLRVSEPEQNDPFSPSVSSYVSDTWALHVAGQLAEDLDAAMRPMVAEWLGVDEGQLTRSASVLGIRMYHRGAVVGSHVDQGKTHPIGVLIHAGHLTDADESAEPAVPWPFVVQDHDGVEHTLPADSIGRAILYEAGVCHHGRQGRFQGREFANVFLHYTVGVARGISGELAPGHIRPEL